jgi:hypothetical protein
MPVQELADNEQGIVSFFIQISPSSEKMTFTFAFWQGFKGPDGINQVAKTASVAGPLAGIGRGANQPYFSKLSHN